MKSDCPSLSEQQAVERLTTFRNAAMLLASSLELQDALTNTISVFLPALGDFGFFDVVLDSEVIRTAKADQDEATEALLRPTRWIKQERKDMNLCALSTGLPALHTGIEDDWYKNIAANDDHLALMRELAFKSMLTVPVRYGDELIGSLTLFMGRSIRNHTAADMDFALELAALAAPVIVNARLLEKQRRAAVALRDSEERLRLAIEAGSMATWQWQIQAGENIWGPGMALLHGFPDDAKAYSLTNYAELVHPEDRGMVVERVQATLAQKTEHRLEYRVIWPDGSIHWLEGRGRIICDDNGEPLQMAGICADITQRKHAEQGLRFVAQVSEELASIVDPQRTLDKIASLAVPSFADWCAIDLVDEDGKLNRLCVAHINPDKMKLGHELFNRYPPDPDGAGGTWHVIRSAQAEFVPELTPEMLEQSPLDREYVSILKSLGLRSYIGVPLSVRNKVLGAITFVSAESRRIYGAEEVALAEDIGRRAAIAIENANFYHKLQEADRRKDEFLAMLAHELRNPLAPIRAASDLLKLSVDGSNIKKTSEVIARQVDHMTQLVDDLLDVSRVTRGLVQLERKPVNLKSVATYAIEQVRTLVDQRGHRLSLLEGADALFVQGDEKRLIQVIANLLSNAAKYTPDAGRIDLCIEGNGAFVGIRVKDNGIGMEPEMLADAFELFAQAKRTSDRSQGGLGLGLALVKSIVELHNGNVRAFSDGLGKGSEFVVQLPRLFETGKGLKNDDKLPAANKGAAKLHILIVDDNVDAAAMLSMLLEASGHHVMIEHGAKSAFERAKLELPDVCLLDIGLPEMDGKELARQLRTEPATAQAVLIAITGYGQENDRKTALDAGFKHHLVKPVDSRKLISILAEIIKA